MNINITNAPVQTDDANVWVATQTFGDDILLALGAGGDQVLLNRSTVLAADAELASVVVGTSVHPAITANSLIVSNINRWRYSNPC